MDKYLPILIIGAIIGTFSLAFIAAYLRLKRDKALQEFHRNMPDREIIGRLLAYAKPYRKQFAVVFVIMLVSIAYDLISPVLVGNIQDLIKNEFALPKLFTLVAVYGGILVVSLTGMYLQTVLLQKVGQRILSDLREDVFSHIESLSHEQQNNIPVGKLVTRVTNDTNSISMMFTNVLVTLVKNSMVIVGVLVAMLFVNYAMTLVVLCFVPFVVLFTLIFQKFSRKAHRAVTDSRTELNTFLSENLSGIKITQIFNRESEKLDAFKERSSQLEKAKFQRLFVFGLFRPMVYLLHISCVLALLYFGSRGYIENTVFLGQAITSGTIVTFYLYASKFFDPIQTLSEQFDILQSAFASAE